MTITELSIKRPILVIVFFTFIGVLGIFGFTQLKYELMPDMAFPVVVISTVYPGASPNEVENTVTKTIEDAITGIDKVKTVSSSSFESRSLVIIELEQNANIDFALQDAQRKVNQASMKMPKDAKTPVLSKISMDEAPILRMGVSAGMNSKDLYQFMIDKVQPRLSKLEGVGAVNIYGGEQREIRVNIDAEKIKAYGISLAGVTTAIKMANMDFPTGKMYTEENQYVVRVAAKFNSLDQLRELIIGKSRTGNLIKLSGVADIYDGTKDITNIYRINGDNSIGLVIQKQKEANTVETANKVKKEIDKLTEEYAKQALRFDIAQDGSVDIMNSANAVKEDLLLAVIIVALIMLVFLHSLRDSLIILVAIPSSLIATLFIMYVTGMTLNMMTLLAMSLVIGILVDDSIVVLENIHKHLEKGENQATAALRGRNEIGFAALSITMVDVVVFLPLALITGVIGNLLREYALVVVTSTLMSLVVSFTVTPMLASRFSKLENKNKDTFFSRIGKYFENFISKLTHLYTEILEWALNNGGKIVAGITLILISTVLLFKFGMIGTEFSPKADNGELSIQIEANPGSTVETTNELVRQVEKRLSGIKDVTKIVTNVGSATSGMMSMSQSNAAEIMIKLVDKNSRDISTELYGQKIKSLLSDIPVRVKVSQPSMGGSNVQAPLQLLITGTTLDDVMTSANKVKKIIENTQGTFDVRLSTEESNPEIKVDIDREKLAAYGLSIAEVGQTLQIALSGNDDSKYREGTDEYDIRIMLDKFDRNNIENVRNITFMNQRGQNIYLNQFAQIEQTVGPTKLERRDRIRAVTVSSNVFGSTAGTIASQITKQLQQTSLPDGVNWKFIGEQENMATSMQSLLLAIAAGILFVYMIMVALYNSFLYPFVVLFSIPLAVIGAFLGLALTMKSISIFSMLGMIMLIGLVAKNAILLVDRTNEAKAEGLSLREALMDAGKNRLRPILMTTLAMVFAMLPIALSTALNSEGKSGLAVVLIGGLTSSLIFTLVLVPVVYQKFDKMKDKRTAKKQARKQAKLAHNTETNELTA